MEIVHDEEEVAIDVIPLAVKPPTIVFDFGGLPDLIAEGLSTRMLMEHRDAQGQSVFTSQAWRRLFDIRGPLLGGARRHLSWRQFILALGLYTPKEMETVGFGAYWVESARPISNKGDLRDYWIGISSTGDFLGTAPSYTFIRDPILRLCHRLIACSIAGRSQAPEKICVKFEDTWAWVPAGSARQEGDAGGVAEEALVAPGGSDEDEEMP
ncbi:hypothetical protein Tco_1457200 [Tanacetum coccineum]